jgi:hypothetical protein
MSDKWSQLQALVMLTLSLHCADSSVLEMVVKFCHVIILAKNSPAVNRGQKRGGLSSPSIII